MHSDNHIRWVTLMPFAFINPIDSRTNPVQFSEKIVKIDGFEKRTQVQIIMLKNFKAFYEYRKVKYICSSLDPVLDQRLWLAIFYCKLIFWYSIFIIVSFLYQKLVKLLVKKALLKNEICNSLVSKVSPMLLGFIQQIKGGTVYFYLSLFLGLLVWQMVGQTPVQWSSKVLICPFQSWIIVWLILIM